MIRNAVVTAVVSVAMGLFAVAYTSATSPEDRLTMPADASEPAGSLRSESMPPETGATLFRKHVRPLLVRTCLKCHDSDQRSGGLDLTRRATALAGGETGEALVPGKPEESLLFQLVTAGEMPKESSPLSPEQIAFVKRWIELGAPYEDEPVTADEPMDSVAATASGDTPMCPCMAMMMGRMRGQGMMGMGGQATRPAAPTKPLSNPRTTEQARRRAEEHLKGLGNPNLQVGDVNETVASYEIQVITKDDSLVNWIIVDKKSGELRTLY